MKRSSTPFYLTGGTALSRFYFNHRFSDDLDLFVNNDQNYESYIDIIYKEFVKEEGKESFHLDYNRQSKSKDFSRFVLLSNDSSVVLQVDMVNDVSKHFGEFKNDQHMGLIDSWRNILSNKISAIFRYEPKDIVDIWIICKNNNFDWQEIISEAKTKEIGVDPIIIYEIIKSFQPDLLDSIKWNIDINKTKFIEDLACIADDILQGRNNSLF